MLRLVASDVIIEDDYVDVVEIYLFFAHAVTTAIEKTILLLESDSTTFIDVDRILRDLHNNLKSRLEQKFFGAQASAKLKLLPPSERSELEMEFLNVYKIMLVYLEKRFDMSDASTLHTLAPLSLENGEITYDDFVAMVNTFKLEDINLDDLFDECVLVNAIGPSLNSIKSVEAKWVKIFGVVDNSKLKNVFRIVSFVQSIPASNAFAERVFSVMSIKWSDAMSRKTVELVKSELLVYVNINLSCSDFYEKCIADNKLLESAKTSLKYD